MFQCSLCSYSSACRSNVNRHRKLLHSSTGVTQRKPVETPPPTANTINNGDHNTNTVNHNNNTFNININIASDASSSTPTIRLRNFGDEDTSYISIEMNDKCLLVLCTSGLEDMVRAVHLNDAHPENQNVKIYDQRANLMQYFRDGRWVARSKHDILNAVINNASTRMESSFASRHRDDQTAMRELENQIVQKHKEKTRRNLRTNLYGGFLQKHKDEL